MNDFSWFVHVVTNVIQSVALCGLGFGLIVMLKAINQLRIAVNLQTQAIRELIKEVAQL